MADQESLQAGDLLSQEELQEILEELPRLLQELEQEV